MRKRFSRLAVAVAIMATGVGVLTATSSSQTDVITANRVSITIDGYEIATFSELTSIVSEVETPEFFSTSDKGPQVNKLAGTVKPPEITLKRGMNGSLELWSWFEAVRTGNMAAARRSCSLTMYDSTGTPVAKFWLEKAFPKRMELAGLKAGASEALIETVVLTADYIQRLAP